MRSEPLQLVNSHAAPPAARRSLVLVAGSGRSGTSLFTGILQRLGYTVPQPEVPADETNPRGFGESQWVVDFHTRLLSAVRVQVADARPGAWALTAEAGLHDDVRRELRGWLDAQFAASGALIVKDPRLSWFLPLWRACARDVGAAPSFVTMLRHPAAVLDSKLRWYRGWQGDVGRAAGWINQTLFTERATRDARRMLVRYEDLLDDWTRTLGLVGERLDLAVVRDASPASMRRVHEFVDRGLSRSRADWESFAIPAALREQSEQVWEQMSRLADAGPCEPAGARERLDELRAAYIELYMGAEAVAQSSIAAARARPAVPRPRPPAVARLVIARVPAPVRHRVPLRWRIRIHRRLSRSFVKAV